MTNTRQRRLQDEWLGLQRCRALTLASLRSLNEQLEDIRPELSDPPPLEGSGAPKRSQDPLVYGWIGLSSWPWRQRSSKRRNCPSPSF
jgi:hypothetical protein